MHLREILTKSAALNMRRYVTSLSSKITIYKKNILVQTDQKKVFLELFLTRSVKNAKGIRQWLRK